ACRKRTDRKVDLAFHPPLVGIVPQTLLFGFHPLGLASFLDLDLCKRVVLEDTQRAGHVADLIDAVVANDRGFELAFRQTTHGSGDLADWPLERQGQSDAGEDRDGYPEAYCPRGDGIRTAPLGCRSLPLKL